jgi:hypothetical protein
MKATKILILIAVALTAIACQSEADKNKEREKVCYMNEDFILADRRETTTYNSHKDAPTTLRTWVLHRVAESGDSIYVAEITSEVLADDNKCGCTGQEFRITKELWYNKKVGETLHFDYIRKDRFFRVAKELAPVVSEKVTYAPDYVPEYNKTTTATTPAGSTDGVDFEKERQIMDIERQITDLQRQLEALKALK